MENESNAIARPPRIQRERARWGENPQVKQRNGKNRVQAESDASDVQSDKDSLSEDEARIESMHDLEILHQSLRGNETNGSEELLSYHETVIFNTL